MSKPYPPLINTFSIWFVFVDLITHLEAFVAVARARSFTLGAQDCGVPQPVVSRRVSALERHLGGALLRRTSRRVDLTDLGRTLLPHAADLVARAAHLRELAGAAQAATIVVGVPPGPDPRHLVAARASAADAGMALSFTEDGVQARTELLRRGRLDLALLPCPPDEEDVGADLGAATATGDLRGRRVHLDQLRRNMGEAGRPRRIHLDAEDDVPWIRDPLRRAARAAGLRDDQVCTSTTRTEAVAGAIEYGDVVVATAAWAGAQGLRWRALGEVSLRRSYAVATGGHTRAASLDAVLPALARAAALSDGADPDGADSGVEEPA